MARILYGKKRTRAQMRERIKRRKGSTGYKAFKPRMRKLIYKAYEAGIPSTRRIDEMCGLNSGTIMRWLDKGKEKEEAAFYAFRQKIMRIKMQKEIEMLECIESCAHGGFEIKETEIRVSSKGKSVRKRTKISAPQWQAAAWRLERWLPDDYGLKPVNALNDVDPDDLARDIQAAFTALDNSVPEEA